MMLREYVHAKRATLEEHAPSSTAAATTTAVVTVGASPQTCVLATLPTQAQTALHLSAHQRVRVDRERAQDPTSVRALLGGTDQLATNAFVLLAAMQELAQERLNATVPLGGTDRFAT